MHQPEQSAPVIFGKFKRWNTIMHFRFGPCSSAAPEECRSVLCVVVVWRWVGGIIFKCSRCFKVPQSTSDVEPSLNSLMWSRQPSWHATHVDLVIPDRKPPCSHWCKSWFPRLWIYNMAYSSYTSHFEHNYTIASKAHNLSFIKVITGCLPYGLIVFHVLTSVWTVRESAFCTKQVRLITVNSTEKWFHFIHLKMIINHLSPPSSPVLKAVFDLWY